MKRRRKRRGAVATLANSLPHPILQAALAECARFGAQLSPITIELFEKDTMPDIPITIIDLPDPSRLMNPWTDAGVWPACEIAWPCCSSAGYAPAMFRLNIHHGRVWQCPFCAAELSNHTMAAAYPFPPFLAATEELGHVARARVLSPQVSDVVIGATPAASTMTRGDLAAMISTIRSCIEEVERRAPLEAAQRLAVHLPMRDERDLASAYVELREILATYFPTPDAAL